MIKQEILDKLIPHYERCIAEIDGMNEEEFLYIREYLEINYINHGICWCAENLLGIEINNKWVWRNNKRGDCVWFDTPNDIIGSMIDFMKSDIILSLRKRLQIMKKEYLIPE